MADGEPAAEARLRSHLARAHAELGEHGRARSELESAALAVRLADHAALAASVTEFAGVCALIEHRWPDALEALESTRQQMEVLQNRRGVALADYLRGRALVGLDRPRDALDPSMPRRRRWRNTRTRSAWRKSGAAVRRRSWLSMIEGRRTTSWQLWNR